MLNGVINGFDSFFMWLNSVLKQNLSDYCDLETAQDEYNLVAKDGSILTIFKINGYKSIINSGSYFQKIASPLSSGLDPIFSKSGYAMQVWFSCDPTKSAKVVKEALRPSYETVKRLNMDMEGFLDERVNFISGRSNYEECYIVLWTTPAILLSSDAKQETKNKSKLYVDNKTPNKANQTSDPYAANGLLLNMHNSYVEGVDTLLSNIGISLEKLDVRKAARSVRTSIDEQFTKNGNNEEANWKPFLPGDKIRPNQRVSKVKAEEWDIVWPKLSWQVCPRDAVVLSDSVVKVGDKAYASGYIDLFPKDIMSFTSLFGSLISTNFPWRVSFLLEGDGLSSVSMRALAASLLSFTSGNNKLLKNGVDTLKLFSDTYSQTIVKARFSYSTWCDAEKPTLAEKQLAEMSNLVEGWGSCLVSQVVGDPIAGFMSSGLGTSMNNVGTISAVPLGAATYMLPFSRPSSAWERGAVLFVSPDGKLMPYQPMGSEQSTWIQLIFAPPGSGKSVLMNIMNLGLCLAPGIPRLPRIGICDIGPSSSGLISLLKEALPNDKKHLVQYYRIRMTNEFCINPWDTHLGCRFATAEDMAFLNNFLLLLVTDPNNEKPEDGMTGLVQAVLQDMYFKCSDKGSPKKYDKGVDVKIDECLQNTGMRMDIRTSWWEVVDNLFENGYEHEAMLAQRFAVPVLSDAAASAQEDKIKDVFGKILTSTGESLIDYFSRSIVDILNQYKILGQPTVFDIGEARVVSLDLDEVAKAGGVQAERQSAIMYMLARYVLGKDFKVGPDTINEMPYPPNIEIPSGIPVKEYREYHAKRIDQTKEDKKRLCFDEFHRTSKSQMVREQILVDMREGRKWNLDVTLASQNIKDFDDTMKSFSTGVFIMGAEKEKDIKEIIETFGVEDDAEIGALRNGRVRPPRGGAPGVFMVKFTTNHGKFTQLLSASVGASEMWALSTTAEDVAIRTRLYKRINPAEARKMLAKKFPTGIKKYIENRRENMKSTGTYMDEENANLYDTIITELLAEFNQTKY